jgi:hypothetical protein
MGRASEKGHLVIDLEIVRDPQPLPNGPEGVDNLLSRLGAIRMQPTAPRSGIDDVEAIEP